MVRRPPHPESIPALRRLRDELAGRGDERLALLLAGLKYTPPSGGKWNYWKSCGNSLTKRRIWREIHRLPRT
jgi:hypothetical protein